MLHTLALTLKSSNCTQLFTTCVIGITQNLSVSSHLFTQIIIQYMQFADQAAYLVSLENTNMLL